MSQKHNRPAGQGVAKPAPEDPTGQPEQGEEIKGQQETPDLNPAGIVPADAVEMSVDTESDEGETEAVPVLGTFLVLDGPASYGPVMIGGVLTRCTKGTLYQVTDLKEQVALLATRRFRVATAKDIAHSRLASAGPGGAITREMLPPGAIRGGLNR
jgi:hypothetical protein